MKEYQNNQSIISLHCNLRHLSSVKSH